MKPLDFLLNDLNDEQKQAVTHGEGPLLIVAGAGTGKTTVITKRIAWLILSGICKPDELLALTFTEKAATEMEERVDRLLPYGYVHLWISTFHAFCDRILKQHALDIGISNEYTLLDKTALWLLMRKNFNRFELDYYRPLGNPTKFIHALIKHFSRAKDEEITPGAYIEYAKKMSECETETQRISELAHAYQTYEQLLFEHNALDFGSLIMYTLKLFRDRPALLEKYRTQFKYVLVDEFQDTNWAQYELIKMLSAPKNNLTVVGDDDQSIYKFRGASIANVLEFRKDFPESTNIVLVHNYRSSQKILDKAYQFIQANNPNRLEYQEQLPKKLQSMRAVGVSDIFSIYSQTQRDEAYDVCQSILQLREAHPEISWGDIALLVRSNDTALPFLESLEHHSIPFVFLAQKGLYLKPIILDLLAYIQVCINPYHSPSLYRVLCMSQWNVSMQAIIDCSHAAHKGALSLWEVALKNDQKEFAHLISCIQEHGELAKTAKLVEIILAILKGTGILSLIKEDDLAHNREHTRYIFQFFGKVKKFQEDNPGAKLIDFFETIALFQEAGDEGTLATDSEIGPDTVKVMTVHGSKGLEFEAVFLLNLIDRRFPTIHRADALELPLDLVKETLFEGDFHLEEERRLLYVGMTRAKRFLTFSWCKQTGVSSVRKPSRFLHELGMLPAESTEKHADIQIKEDLPVRNDNTTHQYILPTILSYSQLKAFQTCPLQYKFAFLIKIPTFGKPLFSFGKTMHATLQHFFETLKERIDSPQSLLFLKQNSGYTECENSICVSYDELLAIYQKDWIDEWYISKQQKDEYYQKGKTMLTSFYDDIVKNPRVPLYLEQDFTLKLQGTGEYMIAVKGRIDRIDELPEGGVEIIDYKTGTPKTNEGLTSDDKEQLLVYQLATEEVLGKKVSQLIYYYLEDGSRVSFLGGEKEKEKIKSMIKKTDSEMKESNFSATPGWHCRFCDFKDICEFRQL